MNLQQLTQRANEMAATAAQAAGPALGRAKAAASDLAERATPFARQAAHTTAQGVAAAAGQLDRATKGKYSDRITSVSTRIESTLDRRR